MVSITPLIEGDNLSAINNALEISDCVYLDSGNWLISNTIVVPNYKQLILAPTAIIKPTYDVDVIKLMPGSKLSGGKIDCSLIANYTHACILLVGSTENDPSWWISPSVVKDMELYWRQGSKFITNGYGIRCTCTTTSGKIAFVNFDNFLIHGFGRGISLESTTNLSWVNGLNFNNIIIDQCGWCLYLDRCTTSQGVDGNNFTNMQLQSNTNTSGVIYCSGSNNIFEGMVWDLRPSTTTNGITFTNSSRNNIVNMSFPLSFYTTQGTSSDFITDNGWYNYVVGKKDFPDEIAKTAKNLTFFPLGSSRINVNDPTDGSHFYAPSTFIGNQDDVLACATYRYAVTNSGATSTADSLGGPGYYHSMFHPNPGYYTRWNSPASPIVLTIDLANELLHYIHGIGIMFNNVKFATNIKVDITLNDNSIITPIDTITNNSSIVFIPVWNVTSTDKWGIKTIVLTFSGLNTGQTCIDVQRIFASANYSMGRAWLASHGGTIHTDLTVKGKTNGIHQDSGTSMPMTGIWSLGDIRWNTVPVELGAVGSKYIVNGWRCIGAGNPGTWVEMRMPTGR